MCTVLGVCGIFRRKSVRISPVLGCGSEIFPNDEPLCRRAWFRRRAPSRQMLATVRRMPRTRPGKKPTRTAATGNLSQETAAMGKELLLAGELEEMGVEVDCAVEAVGGGVLRVTADVAGAFD